MPGRSALGPRPRAALIVAAIVLAGCGGGGDGPTGVAADRCIPQRTGASIAVGQSIEGSLATSDCTLTADRTYADYYRLTLTAPRTVTISMSSPSLDSFVAVLDGDTVVAFDDDGGGGALGLDARLTTSLPAGTYIVVANSVDIETGTYTLRVE